MNQPNKFNELLIVVQRLVYAICEAHEVLDRLGVPDVFVDDPTIQLSERLKILEQMQEQEDLGREEG